MQGFSMDDQKWFSFDNGVEVALVSLSNFTTENMAIQVKKYDILNHPCVFDVSFCETEALSGGSTAAVDLYDIDAMFAQVTGQACRLDKIDACTAGYFDADNAEKALMLMLAIGAAYFNPDDITAIKNAMGWSSISEESARIVPVDFPDQNSGNAWTPEIV